MERTIAHVSDLHVGRDRATDAGVAHLALALERSGVDVVLVTGDVTHRGRRSELAAFRRLFAPVQDRVVVVPGNHDRLGEDAGALLMPEPRVTVERRPGLHVVRLDSTAPHNRALLASHGELTRADLAAVDAAVRAAPAGALVALMLHHHLLPLPEEHLGERLASWLGWPHAAELALGRQLLASLRGRCDLVAHGHRHAPSALAVPGATGRPVQVLNAGCTPELGRVRIVTHAAGRIRAIEWMDVAGTALPLAGPGAAATVPAAA